MPNNFRGGDEGGEANMQTGKHNKQCDKSDNDDNLKGDNNNNNNKKNSVRSTRLHFICTLREW